jgi:hypothetical protein
MDQSLSKTYPEHITSFSLYFDTTLNHMMPFCPKSPKFPEFSCMPCIGSALGYTPEAISVFSNSLPISKKINK